MAVTLDNWYEYFSGVKLAILATMSTQLVAQLVCWLLRLLGKRLFVSDIKCSENFPLVVAIHHILVVCLILHIIAESSAWPRDFRILRNNLQNLSWCNAVNV
ncbi:hypothetical protein J6590_077789 [Homalodisca vitripennis]|nr:hypothetical protein J6590_077789 [Homalodisca vitripennis]